MLNVCVVGWVQDEDPNEGTHVPDLGTKSVGTCMTIYNCEVFVVLSSLKGLVRLRVTLESPNSTILLSLFIVAPILAGW